jgi:hypothetical protein
VATEAILRALKQVRNTHDSLTSGATKKLTNEIYGPLECDPAVYPNRYGIIILAQDAHPFDPYDLVPELKDAGFPLTLRSDTAADFVHFIELRTDIGAQGKFLANDEEQNLPRIVD